MLQNRPPIVVILGHVDHGKTSLLDYLRKSNIASREAGGITQSTRSFQVSTKEHGVITFIDTPGHAAFAAMRDRGSKVADIAILIVAGNDGVMPQTKESIEIIRASKIPFIVAITKSDLSACEPDKVKTQLTESSVIVEDFGGDVPVVCISSKTGSGVQELIEMISLVSSLNPPQADSDESVELLVLESKLDSHKGPMAYGIVKNGQLKIGDSLFQKEFVGKARAIFDPEGQSISQANPSMPVEILGLTLVPEVGSSLYSQPHVSSQLVASKAVATSPGPDSVKIILKTDVAGSLEAILSSLPPEVLVISSSTGDITETDVSQAKSSGARIISFNTKLSSSVAKLAEVDHVTIMQFKIIYELLDYVSKLLIPKTYEKILGKASVLAEFKINSDKIAGCKCTEGVIAKNTSIKLIRGEEVVGIAKVKTLRLAKTEAPQVKAPNEFGLLMSPQLDFKISDSIISFETHGTP